MVAGVSVVSVGVFVGVDAGVVRVAIIVWVSATVSAAGVAAVHITFGVRGVRWIWRLVPCWWA